MSEHSGDHQAGLPPGTIVEVSVVKHQPFGFFVQVPGTDARGLVLIVDVKDEGGTTPEDFPPMGSKVRTVVIRWASAREVRLGMKPSQLAAGATGE